MNFKKGFTLLELLVVVAIIGILTTIVVFMLSSAKGKANDAKIQSQLKSMVSQAQLFNGTDSVFISDIVSPSAIDGATAGGTLGKGILFNDTTITDNGLYILIRKLPSVTKIYYGWDGFNVLTGGKWFVAASTSKGASCVDYTGGLKLWTGISPTTLTEFNTIFPFLTTSYNCKLN